MHVHYSVAGERSRNGAFHSKPLSLPGLLQLYAYSLCLTASQASGIPHTTKTVEALFNLVDIDGSGIMEWSEFETFVANEIQEGRDFMEGEFVLPSGAGIQFAAMVDVLRRKSRLQAVMKVGTPVLTCI